MYDINNKLKDVLADYSHINSEMSTKECISKILVITSRTIPYQTDGQWSSAIRNSEQCRRYNETNIEYTKIK